MGRGRVGVCAILFAIDHNKNTERKGGKGKEVEKAMPEATPKPPLQYGKERERGQNGRIEIESGGCYAGIVSSDVTCALPFHTAPDAMRNELPFAPVYESEYTKKIGE